MYNISQTKIFNNWDKICYISSKLTPIEDEYGNELNLYATPVKYKFNYQPVVDTKEAEIQGYGDNTKGLVRALLDINYLGKIKQFDLAYLYGAIPYNVTTDTVYKENVVYYTKNGTKFTALVEGIDYQIGDEITKTLYNDENKVGDNANYRIGTFKPQNTKILVYFEELTKKQGGQYGQN